MSKWEFVEEDGLEVWVNEEIGNVYRLQNGEFVAMLPKVLKFSPFKTSEEAKTFLETKKEVIQQELDMLNEKLVNG